MSDKKETLTRIKMARDAGYELTMLAVLTPLPVATRLAMNRAKLSRRFPNSDALPKSNVVFKQELMNYVPLFDNATVFENTGKDGILRKLAEKKGGKELEVTDQNGLDNALRV